MVKMKTFFLSVKQPNKFLACKFEVNVTNVMLLVLQYAITMLMLGGNVFLTIKHIRLASQHGLGRHTWPTTATPVIQRQHRLTV